MITNTFYDDPGGRGQNEWRVNCGSQRLFASKVRLFYLLSLNRRTAFGYAVRGERSWLRQSARGQKVAGSVSDGVTGIFHWVNLSGHTRPLTELCTRDVLWGIKASGA